MTSVQRSIAGSSQVPASPPTMRPRRFTPAPIGARSVKVSSSPPASIRLVCSRWGTTPVKPVLAALQDAASLTLYSQDDPAFPESLGGARDDTALETSWRHRIDTVPTLIRSPSPQRG